MFIQLFFLYAGTDVVIVKSGRRICGTGGCLANAPLHQNKSYFEFKIQSTGEYLIFNILLHYRQDQNHSSYSIIIHHKYLFTWK